MAYVFICSGSVDCYIQYCFTQLRSFSKQGGLARNKYIRNLNDEIMNLKRGLPCLYLLDKCEDISVHLDSKTACPGKLLKHCVAAVEFVSLAFMANPYVLT
jgi:hypothetical protein